MLDKRQIPALDGVRGIAIAAVMLSHLFAVNFANASAAQRLVGAISYYGWMGVDLFFVLSGFLITRILVTSVGEEGYLRSFYMRRVLRIFPLYYGVLFLLLLLTRVAAIPWHGLFLPLLLYLQNFARFQPLTENMGPNVSLTHLWSLAIEEQFYLLWPFLVLWAKTPLRVLRMSLLGSACALAFRLFLVLVLHDSFTAKFSMFARADALLLGAALAMVTAFPAVERRVLSLAPPVCIALALTVLLSLTALSGRFAGGAWLYAVRPSVLALMFAALLAWALRGGTMCRLMETWPLRRLGRYSYGLYVLHLLFLPFLSRHLRNVFFALYPSKAFAVAATALTIAALSLGAAVLSFNYYEAFFLRLKKRFAPGRQYQAA